MVLRLEELLFPSISAITVLSSVDVSNEAIRIEAQSTTAGRLLRPP